MEEKKNLKQKLQEARMYKWQVEMANYFDEENHIYYYNNIEVPSITEIAKPISFERLTDLPKHILEKARNRGSRVHELAEEYLSGNVREKLELAEMAVKTNPAYKRNIEALKKISKTHF